MFILPSNIFQKPKMEGVRYVKKESVKSSNLE